MTDEAKTTEPPKFTIPPFAAIPEIDGARWCRVEVFGHRSHDGRVTEVERFGTKMCRVELYCRDGHFIGAPEYGGAALFGVTDHPRGEKGCRDANGIDRCLHPDHAAEKEAERARYALPSHSVDFDDIEPGAF
jgi:hypothetical protein